MSGHTETVSRGGPLRGLYFWLMRHAEGRHAWMMLAAVSFAEASFFPIPPDIMLVPMALADRKRALLLAGWCMLWSVLGGLLGYAIGSLLYDSVGHWLISVYGYGSDLEKFRAMYAEVEGRARVTPRVIGLRLYVERKNSRAQRTYLTLGMEEEPYTMFARSFVALHAKGESR